MVKTFFTGIFIDTTLKNLRQLISTFPKDIGSVSVLSHSRIESQISRWSRSLPSVIPHYAVKCNPEPKLLQHLFNNTVKFDCASLSEVYAVKNLSGFDSCQHKSNIIYAHPMKSEYDIKTINSLDIQTTVVDSVEECEKLSKAKWKGSALLRLAVSDSESKMPFSSKFGASLKELHSIAKLSKIPISGISFHVGSGCNNPNQYKDAIEYAAVEGFAVLRKCGHNPKVIDIGGGYPSNPTEFAPIAKSISEALELHVPRNRSVIAEPGRYMGQPSHDLFVRIIAKKPAINGKGWRYVIDESVFGHFSCIPFDYQKPAWVHIPNSSDSDDKKEESVLFGRTCDSLDLIAKGPMEIMNVGDWLYFPLMGAYTSATASEFNGFPKPTLIIDTENLLPNVDDAWTIHDSIHQSRPLTYSNTLKTI
jgi:ornithine decarboxylase